MSARIEEIRQENRGGDVSYRDIEWLCSVASAAEVVVAAAGRYSRDGIPVSREARHLYDLLTTTESQNPPASASRGAGGGDAT